MALNVVCCETALRLELRAKGTRSGHRRIDADDPELTLGTVRYRIAKGLLYHLVGARN
jgi:hypothetical protein